MKQERQEPGVKKQESRSHHTDRNKACAGAHALFLIGITRVKKQDSKAVIRENKKTRGKRRENRETRGIDTRAQRYESRNTRAQKDKRLEH